jgi:hypothetical protein
MRTFGSITAAAIAATSVAFLAGCSNAALPSNGSVAQSATNVTACGTTSSPWIANASPVPCHPNRRRSWITSGLAKSAVLLYVSDVGGEDVDVFSYPDGENVGQLSGFSEPNGLCADSKGDVFITDTYNLRVVEYGHGGTTPIRVLQDPKNLPVGCAVDHTTGNLAVTNDNVFPTPGTIALYKKARGTAAFYSGLFITYFCTYDDGGNLFIDGFGAEGPVAIAELKKGAATVTNIGLNVEAGWAGGLEWDGKYLALGDQFANKFVKSQPNVNVIYQLSIQNGSADVVKTVPLASGSDVVQFALQGKTVIGPDASNEDVGFWKYPDGGSPTKSIGGFYEPVGAAVSE